MHENLLSNLTGTANIRCMCFPPLLNWGECLEQSARVVKSLRMSGVGTLALSAIEVGNVGYAHVGPVGSAEEGEGGHSVVVKDNMMLAAQSEYVALSASHHSLNPTNMLDIYYAKKYDELTPTLLLLLLLVLLLRGLPVGRH